MSHISILKLRIKNPNAELLRQAVEALAKELGGQVVTEVKDYYGNVTKVDIGIVTPMLSRGVGFTVERGEVKMVGDFYMVQHEAKKVENAFTQTYTTLALQASLRSLGYQTQTQKTQEKVFIRAIHW